MATSDRFAGKVAVVTGGASGIGRAIATRFIADGGKVVVADIKTERFEAITEELGADNVCCVECNVDDRPTVDAAVKAAHDTFGSFDVMFGNAGINLFKDFLEFTIEESDKIFDTNFHGVFNASQAAALDFVANKKAGVIVNTSSVNVRCVTPNTSCYAATKAAIAAFTRGIAVELAQYGIRCNCFAPGSTDTEMTGEVARKRFPTLTAKRLVIPRMARPEEQAAVACFLASDDASYMSGEVVMNVGGWGIW